MNPVLICYIILVLQFITIVFFSLVSSEILADAISGRKQVATDDNSVFFFTRDFLHLGTVMVVCHTRLSTTASSPLNLLNRSLPLNRT